MPTNHGRADRSQADELLDLVYKERRVLVHDANLKLVAAGPGAYFPVLRTGM